jgi:hypothetical protein
MDLEEVRAWAIAAGLLAGDQAGSAAQAAAPGVAASPALERLIARLEGGGLTPLEMLDTTLQMIGLNMAMQARAGVLPVAQAKELREAVEELQQQKRRQIELDESAGRLIDRDVVKAVAGAMARRLNMAADMMRNGVGLQVEQWLADAAWLKFDPASRQRVVADWLDLQFGEVRRLEADEIERLIEEQRREDDDEAPLSAAGAPMPQPPPQIEKEAVL